MSSLLSPVDLGKHLGDQHDQKSHGNWARGYTRAENLSFIARLYGDYGEYEEESIINYVHGYTSSSDYLRDLGLPKDERKINWRTNRRERNRARHEIRNLDRAAILGQFENDTIMYRGVDGEYVYRLEEAYTSGELVHQRGYMSVSSSEEFAVKWSEDDVIMRVHVPKGTSNIPIDGTKFETFGEGEYILQRGIKFEVKDVKKERLFDTDITVFDVEIVDIDTNYYPVDLSKHLGSGHDQKSHGNWARGYTFADEFLPYVSDILIKNRDYTDEENEAIKEYVSGSLYVSDYLRETGKKEWTDSDIELAKTHIEDLDSASEAAEFEQNTIMYRGVDTGHYYRLLEAYKSGELIHQRGYMSTSASQSFSVKWSKNIDKTGPGRYVDIAAVMRIKVPKGTNAIQIAGSNLDSYPQEKEFILQRGLKFKVNSISRGYLNISGDEDYEDNYEEVDLIDVEIVGVDESLEKHADHDQKSHGNWARGYNVDEYGQEYLDYSYDKYDTSRTSSEVLLRIQSPDITYGDFYDGDFETLMLIYEYTDKLDIATDLNSSLQNNSPLSHTLSEIDYSLEGSMKESMENFMAYRGIGSERAAELLNAYESQNLEKNEGYMSTSLDPGFASYWSNKYNYNPAVMRIKVPKDSKVISINDLPTRLTADIDEPWDFRWKKFQAEVILNKGHKFRVTNVSKETYHSYYWPDIDKPVTVFDVELVEDDGVEKHLGDGHDQKSHGNWARDYVDAEKVFEENNGTLINSSRGLLPEESSAVQEYVAGDLYVSDYLRETGMRDWSSKHLRKRAKKSMYWLDSYARTNEFIDDVIMYRGVTDDFGARLIKAYETGEIIHQKGYMSTSYTESSALRWGEFIMKIKVPKGTNTIPVNETEFDIIYDEDEYILPRGIKYKVTDVYADSRNYSDYQEELYGDELPRSLITVLEIEIVGIDTSLEKHLGNGHDQKTHGNWVRGINDEEFRDHSFKPDGPYPDDWGEQLVYDDLIERALMKLESPGLVDAPYLEEVVGEIFDRFMSVNSYTANMAITNAINERLREGTELEEGKEYSRIYDDMKVSMEGAKYSFIAYRGVDASRVEELLEVYKTGKLDDNEGFMSTSLDAGFSAYWAGPKGGVMRIKVPKGTPIISINDLPDGVYREDKDGYEEQINWLRKQSEVILDTYQIFRITGVSQETLYSPHWQWQEALDNREEYTTTVFDVELVNVKIKKHLVGQHDQKTHGNWARGLGGSKEELVDYGDEYYPSKDMNFLTYQSSDYSEDEIDAIDEYTAGSLYVSDYLREGEKSEKKDWSNPEEVELAKKHIELLDSAAKKAMFRYNLIMYRGIDLKRADDLLDAYKSGELVKQDGYMSVSSSEEFSIGWSSQQSDWKTAYVMRIKTPKGMNNIPVSGSSFDKWPDEEEYILPRGMSIRVTDVYPSNFTEYTIEGESPFEALIFDVELVPPNNVEKHLGDQHDQKSHGNWARGYRDFSYKGGDGLKEARDRLEYPDLIRHKDISVPLQYTYDESFLINLYTKHMNTTESVNEYLRGEAYIDEEGTVQTKFVQEEGTENMPDNYPMLSELQVNEIMDNLDNALEKTVAKEDFIAYRGLGDDRALQLTQAFELLGEDARLQKAGYMSTSLDAGFAAGWSERQDDPFSSSIMRIKVPKGSPILSINDMPALDLEWLTIQSEVILPRGQWFKIVNISEGEKFYSIDHERFDNVTVFDVELVPTDTIEKHAEHDQKSHGNWSRKFLGNRIGDKYSGLYEDYSFREMLITDFSRTKDLVLNRYNKPDLVEDDIVYSDEELQTVYGYTKTVEESSTLSRALRIEEMVGMDDAVRERIDFLNNVHTKSKSNKNFVAYRGVYGSRIEELVDNYESETIGENKGFMSTSLDAGFAAHWSGFGSMSIMRIKVPKGTPIISINDLPKNRGFEWLKGQTEVILGKGQRFRVVGISEESVYSPRLTHTDENLESYGLPVQMPVTIFDVELVPPNTVEKHLGDQHDQKSHGNRYSVIYDTDENYTPAFIANKITVMDEEFSEEDYDILDRYIVTSDGVAINDSLRDGRSSIFSEDIERLDLAINKSRLRDDFLLFRAVDTYWGDELEKAYNNNKIIEQAGYMSTSSSDVVAVGIAETSRIAEMKHNNKAVSTLMVIKAPKGTKAISIKDDDALNSHYPWQKEILLHRGAKMRVTNVLKNQTVEGDFDESYSGFRVIEVEIIPGNLKS